MSSLNKFSKTVTQDPTQPAAQAMLHAIGLTKEDFFKPIVGPSYGKVHARRSDPERPAGSRP